jgi:hypothetical protein
LWVEPALVEGCRQGEQEQPRGKKRHLPDIMMEDSRGSDSSPEEEFDVHEN